MASASLVVNMPPSGNGEEIVQLVAASGRAEARDQSAWWTRGSFALFLVLLSTVSLILPLVPPLVDVPGHIGRLYLMRGGSPFLDQFYSPGSWPVGNMGADMLIVPLAQVLGIEAASRVVILLIPPATVAAMLWVAREAHRELPPTAAFAVPLAYAQPFLFGFINYSVGLVVALGTFAVWLRLGNAGRLRARAVVMPGLALLTFLAHGTAWGILGLMSFAAEMMRNRDRGDRWAQALGRSILHCLPLALPLVTLLFWGAGSGGLTADWFGLSQKAQIITIFRDRWMIVDLASLFILGALLLHARGNPNLGWSRPLVGASVLLLLAFLLLPGRLFGSGYTDMRVAPVMLMLMVLAIGRRRDADPRAAQRLAIAAVGFAVVRLGCVAVSLHLAAERHEQLLVTLEHLPKNSRLAALVYRAPGEWSLPRNDHIGSLAIVRRDSFSNDQWEVEGGTSVDIHYPAAGRFQDDSSLVSDGVNFPTIEQALAQLPIKAFDALWLVDSAPRPTPTGWSLVHHAPGSALYLRTDQAGRRATHP